jgi:hypothetical protein
MGLRLRKILTLAPGLRINLSKSGASLSVGPKGATVNLGRKGVRGTVGLPGTGLSYSEYKAHTRPAALPFLVVLGVAGAAIAVHYLLR